MKNLAVGISFSLALASSGLFVLACDEPEDLEPRAKKNKVSVCHIDGHGEFSLLEVAESAVPAHLDHGDHLAVNGSCDQEVPLTVAVGDSHICAHSGDRVQCWGGNWLGQLGLGDTADRGDEPGEMGDTLPLVDFGAGRTPTAIAAGGLHSCALLADHTVLCFGFNANGQLGQGDQEFVGDEPGELAALPAIDLGAGVQAFALAAGQYFNCALVTGGRVKCWGDSSSGQLGLGNPFKYKFGAVGDGPGEMGDALPHVDLGEGQTAVSIAAGPAHVCATLAGGTVKCWGYGGAFGRPGVNIGDEPGEMGDDLEAIDLGADASVVAVGLGDGHSCALLGDGRVKCWGFNFAGQLGLGDVEYRDADQVDALPAVDLGAGRTAVDITAGQGFTCAVLDDGSVKCWGANYAGSLGLGDAEVYGDDPGEMGDALPAVHLGTGRTARQVEGNGYSGASACAVLDNGGLKCWGFNKFGKLGLGDTEDRGDEPGEMGDVLPFVDVFAGG